MVDLSDLLSHSLRGVMPQLRAQQMSYTFDEQTDGWRVHDGPARLLERSLHRLLRTGVELLESGCLSLRAIAGKARAKGCVLHVKVGGTGRMAGSEEALRLLRELDLRCEAASPVVAGQTWLRRAHGECPLTRAPLNFSSLPPAVFVFDARYEVQAFHEGARATAQPRARAWIMQPDGVNGASISRQAQRQGWLTTFMPSLDDVARRLRGNGTGMPAVLLVFAHDALRTKLLHAVRERLPATTCCVLALEPGSLWLGEPGALPGWQMRCHPFGSGDWLRWGNGDDTRQATQRPVLLVDGDASVAQATFDSLGQPTHTAHDAAAALAAFRETAPALVLIDLLLPQAIESVRQMRVLQRNGSIAPCPIVALTGAIDPPSAQAAIDAGIDGIIARPVHSDALQAELNRWYLHA